MSAPFRHFAKDLLSWSCATDLRPRQQAAVAVLNLGGAPRDLTRELNSLALLQGGTIPPAQPGGQPTVLDATSFLITSEDYSWTLLKACGIRPDQMNILLAPLQGRLPTTDAELTRLQAYIRRMGYMVDVRGRGKARGISFSMTTRLQILLLHLLLMS